MSGEEQYISSTQNPKIKRFPIALGVIRDVEAPTYNDAVTAQIAEVSAQKKYHTFAELLETNDIWEVK